MLSHATPAKRDVTYDRRAQQAELPIRLHNRDGTTQDTLLVLTPSEMELYCIQLEQAISKRGGVVGRPAPTGASPRPAPPQAEVA